MSRIFVTNATGSTRAEPLSAGSTPASGVTGVAPAGPTAPTIAGSDRARSSRRAASGCVPPAFGCLAGRVGVRAAVVALPGEATLAPASASRIAARTCDSSSRLQIRARSPSESRCRPRGGVGEVRCDLGEALDEAHERGLAALPLLDSIALSSRIGANASCFAACLSSATIRSRSVPSPPSLPPSASDATRRFASPVGADAPRSRR